MIALLGCTATALTIILGHVDVDLKADRSSLEDVVRSFVEVNIQMIVEEKVCSPTVEDLEKCTAVERQEINIAQGSGAFLTSNEILTADHVCRALVEMSDNPEPALEMYIDKFGVEDPENIGDKFFFSILGRTFDGEVRELSISRSNPVRDICI